MLRPSVLGAAIRTDEALVAPGLFAFRPDFRSGTTRLAYGQFPVRLRGLYPFSAGLYLELGR